MELPNAVNKWNFQALSINGNFKALRAYVPYLAVQIYVSGHGLNDGLRDSEFVSLFGVKRPFVRIPKATNAVVFFKQPPLLSDRSQLETPREMHRGKREREEKGWERIHKGGTERR